MIKEIEEATLVEMIRLLKQHRNNILVWVSIRKHKNAVGFNGLFLKVGYAEALEWCAEVADFNRGKVLYRRNGAGDLFLGSGIE